MRNFKKIAAVVLSVAMLLSLMSISAFAAGDKLIDMTITADKTTIAPGESVDISIDFTPKAAGMFIQGNTTFEFIYDKNSFDAVVKSIDASWEALSDVTPNFTSSDKFGINGGQFGVGNIMSVTGEKMNIAVVTLTAKSTASGEYTIAIENFNGNTSTMEAFDADITNAIVKVGDGGDTPDPTPTATAAPVETATPTPTAAPTDAPEANRVTVNVGTAIVGRDFTITVNRTDASEEATVEVTLTPEKEGAAPVTKTVTFAVGETKLTVTFTAEEMENIAENGESFNVVVKYNGEEVKNVDCTMRKGGTSTGNSGLTTGANGVTGGSTPKPGLSTDDTTEPTEVPVVTTEPSNVVFEDVPATYWGYDYIMDLYENGIVNGTTATLFMPEANVTRAEFTKMAAGIFGLTATSTVSQFTDVPAGEWFTPYVIAASEAGIVQGVSETEFAPNDNVTREQMAAIIGRQLGTTSTAAITFTDAASIEDYARPYVAALAEAGYLTGDETGAFNPKNNATRAEAAALLDRVYVDLTVAEPTEAPEATEEPEVTAEPEATAEVEATEAPEATAEATETPAE